MVRTPRPSPHRKVRTVPRLSSLCIALLISLGIFSCSSEPGVAPDGSLRVPVDFSGGYDTDPADGGRPVALIAAALGVEPEVFRQAFSGVEPARGGAPSEAQVQANKAALLAVLGPLGITNERLDEVSDYYRYRPGDGRLWEHRPAKAFALVKEGQVHGFDIVDRGAGYTTPPLIAVASLPNLRAAAQLYFSTDLKTNGSLKGMIVAE